MKEGAILLNTSRGDVVDEAALIDALNSRGIRAGLDVFANEPDSGTGDFDSALAKHPSVVATHHVGASTAQAQSAITDGTLEAIDAYRAGSPINCVNLNPVPTRAATLTVRHHDRVGVLANVLQALRKEQLNVSNMQNRVFAGSKAAVASIDVGHLPSQELIDEVMSLDDVIYVSVTPA
jgi:D-3-phosphoglycerate dehydrogenase